MLERITHAQMPLINAHASVDKARLSMQNCIKTSEKRVDLNQLISLWEDMLIPYESISLHLYAHAALALFDKRLSFIF